MSTVTELFKYTGRGIQNNAEMADWLHEVADNIRKGEFGEIDLMAVVLRYEDADGGKKVYLLQTHRGLGKLGAHEVGGVLEHAKLNAFQLD